MPSAGQSDFHARSIRSRRLLLLITAALVMAGGLLSALGLAAWPAARAQALQVSFLQTGRRLVLTPAEGAGALAVLMEGSPYLAFGSASQGTAVVGWSRRAPAGGRRTLVRFDLSVLPSGAIIERATLSGQVIQTNGLPMLEVRASPAGGQWQAGKVNWANQPAALPEYVVAQVSETGSVQWDVTDWARMWMRAPRMNHGLILWGLAGYPEDNERTLSSLELELVFRPPSESANAGECDSNRIINGDFESWLDGWSVGGETLPTVAANEAYDGMFSLLLGGFAIEDLAGDSIAWQRVRIPADATAATLALRYKIQSDENDSRYDYWDIQLLDVAGRLLTTLFTSGTSGDWALFQADLLDFRGQTLILALRAHNDGNAGHTSVYVDGISLCVQRPSGAEPTPAPIAGLCELPGNLMDYAPAGLPDFSARQSDWNPPAGDSWSHDGPAALANVLWWMDARLEPAPAPPSIISDGYPLVGAYGPWDDHAPENVVPLITELANLADTNGLASGDRHLGTRPEDLFGALTEYLVAKGLADQFQVELIPEPRFDVIRHHVLAGDGVVILVGFEQWGVDGWRRLGGRYMAVAGAGCTEHFLAVSDPLRDWAEAGHRGRVAPWGDHPHPLYPPDDTHNDAAYVSHDIYEVALVDEGWGLSGYFSQVWEIVGSLGMNAPTGHPSDTLTPHLYLPIASRVEYALILRPRSPEISVGIHPNVIVQRGAAPFQVSLVVNTGLGPITHCDLYLRYDPTRLEVVDASGQPALAISSTGVLAYVDTNLVLPSEGIIHFAAHAGGEGPAGALTLAKAYFRPIGELTAPLTTSLHFIQDESSPTQLWSGPTPLDPTLYDADIYLSPGAKLALSLLLQGRPAPPHASYGIPVLVTCQKEAAGEPAIFLSAQADQRGQVQIDAPLPVGMWDVTVRGLHTLPAVSSAVALVAGDNTLSLPLLEGDATQDGIIAIEDLSLLAASYSKQRGEDGFNPLVDLDEDGQVSEADLALLMSNWRRSAGALAVSRLGTFGTVEPGAITLALLPSGTKTTLGTVFPVRVRALGFATEMDAVGVYLDFDPTILQVVNAQGERLTQVGVSNALSTIIVNQVDNRAGRIDLAMAQLTPPLPEGMIELAEFYLKPIAPTKGTWLRFSSDAGRRSAPACAGENVLRGYSAMSIQVEPARVVLPLLGRR